ncbi:MAG TPA: hypothetical protein VGD60_19525 [Candidatus Acidoferrales bacterium]
MASLLFVPGVMILMAQRNRNSQRGGSRISSILMLVVLGVMAFAAFRIVPAYFADYQLNDAITTEARFAMVNRKAAADVQDDVWKKVQELGIPAKKNDIVVSSEQGNVKISVNYTVPVDLVVMQKDLQFHDSADNKPL